MAPSINRGHRTPEQAVADQIDCDLDNMARRCRDQSIRAPREYRKHWEMLAHRIDLVRNDVRLRMHELDKEATI